MSLELAGVTVLLLGSALIGCASVPTAGDPPVPLPEPTETLVHSVSSGAPPPFTVRYGATELELSASTWCDESRCVDGIDPDPPAVGSPDELLVFVPVPGFDSLHVSQRDGEDWCTSRTIESQVTELGAGWWSVRPRGDAGEWTVELFARGDGAGDMVASVVWATPVDHPLPAPTASLVVVADHDGEPDSYGVEFWVANLEETPTEATASITVTAARGESLTFDATRSSDCAGAGALFFDGPDRKGTEAAALGDFPFTYTVVLTIDGVAHTASGVYPDDAPPQDLAVPLVFRPALD